MHRRIFAAVFAALMLNYPAEGAFAADPQPDQLGTLAEASGFLRTGRYEEVDRLCHAFESRFSSQVKCFSFGTTPENRPLWALAVSGDGLLSAEQARAHKRPVILVQGGIHAGEIDGKDASFLVLRELLTESRNAATLRAVTLVFVPVFNVDGHERFGRWNRPNQTGPEEMGWRATAQNLNLNRDFAKAEAPEMRAMLKLLNEWDPVVYIDLHVTDGAQFEHDVAVMSEPRENGDSEVAALAANIRDSINAKIAKQGSLPLIIYPAFDIGDDPSSGITATPGLPRFCSSYWGLRNRVGLLVETHSWKDYPTRVRVTANILRALFDSASREASKWQATLQRADQRALKLAGSTYPLSFAATDDVRWMNFRGYAYERVPSAISGTLMTRYDPSRPLIWRMPVKDKVSVVAKADVPKGGYLVPPAVATWLVPRLEDHGIRSQPYAATDAPVSVQTWRASEVKIAPQTFEGRTVFELKGSWANESRALPSGMVFVPAAQPKVRLAMALLEPNAPDSYAAWGYFASAFERKEYMEGYVAEQVGERMLAENAELRKEFMQRLATDQAFARDPAARLDFFYRKHESWDERVNLYPVYRLDRPR